MNNPSQWNLINTAFVSLIYNMYREPLFTAPQYNANSINQAFSFTPKAVPFSRGHLDTMELLLLPFYVSNYPWSGIHVVWVVSLLIISWLYHTILFLSRAQIMPSIETLIFKDWNAHPILLWPFTFTKTCNYTGFYCMLTGKCIQNLSKKLHISQFALAIKLFELFTIEMNWTNILI